MVVDSQKGKNVTGRMITARRSIKDVNAAELQSEPNRGGDAAPYSKMAWEALPLAGLRSGTEEAMGCQC
jgi:hypothetical protein